MPVQIPYPLPAKQDVVETFGLESDIRELHKQGALVKAEFPFGGVGWIAVRYNSVKAVLGDPRFSVAAAADLDDYPRIRQVEVGPPFPPGFVQMDPPMHSHKRQVLMKHLTVKRVRGLRPHTEQLAESLISSIKAQGTSADFVEQYARILPVTVIGRMIGSPPEEHERFLDHAYLLSNGRAETPEQAAHALNGLREYFEELVERRRREPSDDLLSALIADTEIGGRWTEEELKGVGVVLLLAGHDATAGMLGGIIEWIAHDKDTFDRLKHDPSKFPQAFEEFVRFLPAGLAGTRSRIATEDVQIGDVLVRKGEAVLPIVHGANFDETAFAEADVLDIDRSPANPHVAFGFGPHGCIGSQVARMEIDVAVRAILENFDRFEAISPDPNWRTKRLLRGPREVHVTW